MKNKRPPASLNFAVTNARSLVPKCGSLIDYFCDLELTLAIICETWFHKSDTLESFQTKLKAEENICFLNKMRKKTGKNNPGGGVSIAYNESKVALTEFPITRGKYEIVCAKGKIKGNTRLLFVIGAYLPPKLKAAEHHECLELIGEAILRIKTEFRNPYIILGGDFNGKDIHEAIGDYPDIEESDGGATRGDSRLDLCATNFPSEIRSVTNHPPLTSEEGTPSDHRLIGFVCDLKHTNHFEWVRFSSRKITDAAREEYDKRMRDFRWDMLEGTPDDIANQLHHHIQSITNDCFPLKNHKVRSTDDPWIDEETRKMIERRKDLFSNKGRESTDWRQVKSATTNMIRRRKKRFYDKECMKLSAPGAHNIAYKALKRITNTESTTNWDVRQLRPELGEEELAEALADFFAAISNEFQPLGEFPLTFDRAFTPLTVEDITRRLISMKKPSSAVSIDPLPKTINGHAHLFAVPLTKIFNAVRSGQAWPSIWKEEEVSVIPKGRSPGGLRWLPQHKLHLGFFQAARILHVGLDSRRDPARIDSVWGLQRVRDGPPPGRTTDHHHGAIG